MATLSTAKSKAISFSWRTALLIGAPFIAAAALRLFILPTSRTPFEGDEAIFLLTARHILAGERPLFFYGEAYGGTSDAYLTALFYWLLDDTVAVGRLVQALEYLTGMLFTYLLSRRLLPGARLGPLAVLWLMAIPPLMVSAWTTPAVLYAVILGLGALLTYQGYRLLWEDADRPVAWILFGLVCGLSFWTFGILVVYMLPLFALFLWRFRRRRLPYYLLSAIAFFLGSLPWWTQPLAGFQVVDDTNNPFGGVSLAFRLIGFFGLLLPGFFGFREPWSTQLIWPLLIPVVMGFYLAAIFYALPFVRRRDELAPRIEPVGFILLGGQVISWALLYFGTRFSTDPTGRYILPLYPALFITAGLLIERLWRWRRWAGAGLLAALLAYNLAAHVRSVQTVPPGIIAQTHPALQFGNAYDQALIEFVAGQGGRGYSHHWITFKIAFLSDEEVILVSYLPYLPDLRWNPRDTGRYPPYAAAVAASPEPVYVTHREPNLEQYLQQALAARNISYQIKEIGPYRVYYDLSSPVTPQEIGLAGGLKP